MPYHRASNQSLGSRPADQNLPITPGRLYTGPNPPIDWEPQWPSYSNLTSDLIAAFEAFPQDLTFYSTYTRWNYENRIFPANAVPLPNNYITIDGVPIYPTIDNRSLITAMAMDAQMNPSSSDYNFTVNGAVYILNNAQALSLFSQMRAYVQQCRDIEASCINGINSVPPTITTRDQIDAAFAVLN